MNFRLSWLFIWPNFLLVGRQIFRSINIITCKLVFKANLYVWWTMMGLFFSVLCSKALMPDMPALVCSVTVYVCSFQACACMANVPPGPLSSHAQLHNWSRHKQTGRAGNNGVYWAREKLICVDKWSVNSTHYMYYLTCDKCTHSYLVLQKYREKLFIVVCMLS